MMQWVNHKINLLQPELKLPHDNATLPSQGYVPVLSDIVIPSIVIAVALIVTRNLFDRFIVFPFGTFMGVKDVATKKEIYPNRILESEYNKTKSLNPDNIVSLSKKSGLTERQVHIWFRRRKRNDQVSDMKRLSDTSWSFIFYITVSWYGIYVLWDKPWFEDTANCWIGWPFQTVSNDVYWYYVIELGFYVSYLYMLFTDHKRKDFTEFVVHHTVTVALMVLSWAFNVVRIGTIVLCIHDPVDYIVAIAKAASYCKKQNLADVFFAIFLVTWLVTRLFIYPYIVLYTVYIELAILADDSKPYLQHLNASVIGHFLRALLVVLQILHIMWTIHILRSAATKFTKGKLQDTRSDTEDDGEDEVYDREINKTLQGNNNVDSSIL